MQMNEHKKRVPSLRFKDFKDEWEKYSLEEVTDKIQDGTHFSPKILEEKTPYRYVTSKNIRPYGKFDSSTIQYISKDDHDKIYKRCNVVKGDILLTKDGASTGNLTINPLEGEISLLSSVAFLRANNKHSTTSFLYQVIYGQQGQKEIKLSISGQAITRITLTKIRNYKFYFPSLPEQKKIANFLSTFDKQISLLEQKTKQLEAFKKGTMQQLFSQKLRFKEENGEDFPAWEVKRLGQLIKKSFSGGTPSRKQTEYYTNGTIPWIKSGELNNIYIKSTGEYITELGLNNSSAKIAPKNTLLYALYGATAGVVGFTKIEAALNQAILAIIPKDFLSKYFLFHTLKHRKKNILSKLTQGGQPNLSATLVKSLKIPLPSLPEQKKIADCLNSIDQQIQDSRAQLEATKVYKKGLLQQLLV